jgi:hypothetical protein
MKQVHVENPNRLAEAAVARRPHEAISCELLFFWKEGGGRRDLIQCPRLEDRVLLDDAGWTVCLSLHIPRPSFLDGNMVVYGAGERLQALDRGVFYLQFPVGHQNLLVGVGRSRMPGRLKEGSDIMS